MFDSMMPRRFISISMEFAVPSPHCFTRGELNVTDPCIKRRLDRTGLLDEARAEGFAAGLWFWSLMAVVGAFEEESHVEEWAEFFEGETAGDVAGVQG